MSLLGPLACYAHGTVYRDLLDRGEGVLDWQCLHPVHGAFADGDTDRLEDFGWEFRIAGVHEIRLVLSSEEQRGCDEQSHGKD